MSLQTPDIDPTIASLLASGRPRINTRRLPIVDTTPESRELRKIENRLSSALLSILRKLVTSEIKTNTTQLSLKDKYNTQFATPIRSEIENVYRLGGQYALGDPELYYTTQQDLILMRRYTTTYINKLWGRVAKYILFRETGRTPITGDFIVNTIASEIATVVMMAATKEKTAQLMNQSTLTVESASIGLEPDAFSKLVKLEMEDNINNPSLDGQKWGFIWRTAHDDKTCKRYCAPLDGLMWTLNEVYLIPLPDTLTHPHCRCRLIRIPLT